MNNIEKYVDSIIKEMNISKKERQEYRFQFIDHITALKEDYIKKGLSEDEAAKHAIKDFGSEIQILENGDFSRELKGKVKLIVSAVFIIYCTILFGHYIKLAGAEGNGGNLVALKSLIPIKTILGVMRGIAMYGFSNMYLDILITYIIMFIPVGALIPLLSVKVKTLKSNIKVFIIIVLAFQFIKLIFLHKVVNVDFALMNLLGCFIGYQIYRSISTKVL